MKNTVSQRPLLARLAAIAALATVLTACSAINPITTDVHYAPSDGVQVAIGDDAKALNLLVVTTAKGAPAVLTGSIHNGGEEDLPVTLSIDGTIAANVTVAPGATVQLGTAEGQTLVQGTSPSAPGGVAPVWIGTTATGALQSDVPVVDGTFEQYQSVVDSIPPLPVVTPTPTPSPSASPTA